MKKSISYLLIASFMMCYLPLTFANPLNSEVNPRHQEEQTGMSWVEYFTKFFQTNP